MNAGAFAAPAVLPGALDEILSDLAQQDVEFTRSAIISAALDRRHPADFAAALADAAERRQQEDGQ